MTTQPNPGLKGGTVPPLWAMQGLTRSEVAAGGAIRHRWIMMFDPGPIRRPNPLAPSAMTPAERRTELCGLLALGLMRLKQRERGEVSAGDGDIPLHNSVDRSGSAGATDRRPA